MREVSRGNNPAAGHWDCEDFHGGDSYCVFCLFAFFDLFFSLLFLCFCLSFLAALILLYPHGKLCPRQWPRDPVLRSVKQQLSLDQQQSMCGAERR